MLHWAAQLFNQSVAMNLSSELTIWANSNRNKELPEEWQIEGLTDKFHDYPVIFNGTSSPVKQILSGTNPIPAINIFQGGKNDNGYNRNKKFELKHKVQCKCCQMAGHTISDQICRFGAQVKYIQTYGKDNKSTFDENAVRYKSMNKTRVISKVMTEDTTITNMEELMDATVDRQSFYHDNDSDQ